MGPFHSQVIKSAICKIIRIFRDDKVMSKYYPIVISYAGSVGLSKYFIEIAYQLAQTQSYNSFVLPKPPKVWQNTVTSGAVLLTPNYEYDYYVDYSKYINQLGPIVHDLNQKYSGQVGSSFEVTVSTQIDGNDTRLCNITVEGEVHDGIDIKCIGSASGYAAKALTQKWNKDISMKETAQLGFTILNTIGDGLDRGTGFGNQDPQIWFIPKNGQIYYANDEMKAEFRQNAKDRMTEYKKIMMT